MYVSTRRVSCKVWRINSHELATLALKSKLRPPRWLPSPSPQAVPTADTSSPHSFFWSHGSLHCRLTQFLVSDLLYQRKPKNALNCSFSKNRCVTIVLASICWWSTHHSSSLNSADQPMLLIPGFLYLLCCWTGEKCRQILLLTNSSSSLGALFHPMFDSLLLFKFCLTVISRQARSYLAKSSHLALEESKFKLSVLL